MVFSYWHAVEQHLWSLTQEPHTPELKQVKPEDPYYGMSPWMYALVFGIVSGTSLPIGAWLGIYFSPVKDKVCALMMAFGAGALLFAVTVELYGHALHEVSLGNLGLFEMFTTIFGALLGAAFYLTINKWLEEYLVAEPEEKEGEDVEGQEGSASSKPEKKSLSVMDALKTQSLAKQKEDEEAARQNTEEESSRAKSLWKKAKVVKTVGRSISTMKPEDLQKLRGRTKVIQSAEDVQHAKSVAFALFLGLLVDGVPEGVLMGFLAAEGHLTPVLIVSLFVANFPEAFSSASLLIQAGMSTGKIIGMWTGLCILVGCLGGASCFLLLLMFPEYGHGGLHNPNADLPMSVLLGIALVEGITGGAMIACISSVMLPEAFERAGKSGPFYSQSGFLCTSGFLLSVALKAVFG